MLNIVSYLSKDNSTMFILNSCSSLLLFEAFEAHFLEWVHWPHNYVLMCWYTGAITKNAHNDSLVIPNGKHNKDSFENGIWYADILAYF